MNEINFRPTKQQEKYIEAVDWYINDNIDRGVGRTSLVAYRYISYAIKNPGRRVYLLDFGPGKDHPHYKKIFGNCVLRIIKDSPEIRDKFKFYLNDTVIEFNK